MSYFRMIILQYNNNNEHYINDVEVRQAFENSFFHS